MKQTVRFDEDQLIMKESDELLCSIMNRTLDDLSKEFGVRFNNQHWISFIHWINQERDKLENSHNNRTLSIELVRRLNDWFHGLELILSSIPRKTTNSQLG